ncbi:sulfatase family protein [Halobaculum rarum]|uniref:sulfatase family protein n=1 Tax=Halobaculum rarum TaxID=3075122 RepID=UPI0032AEDC00
MSAQVENVVLIVADALRPDRVGAYSGGELTPNIDQLAAEGQIFENCFACINATDSSMTTLLTGLYPTSHGILNHGKNITTEEMEYVSATTPLPQRLPSHYETVAFDKLERWHDRGFDRYINVNSSDEEGNHLLRHLSNAVQELPSPVERFIRRGYRTLRSGDPITESERLTKRVSAAIEDADSPFFHMVHYWDTHIPYLSREHHPDIIAERKYDDTRPLDDVLDPIQGSQWAEHLNRLRGTTRTVAEMSRKYDAGVWAVDNSIGQVIDKLRAEGVYDETAIIVTADHGESFTEHGIIFDHHGLYDSTVHVPLLIRAPGFEGRESDFVQHYDIVPTILDLLDIDYQEAAFDGVSLASSDIQSLDRDAVYAEEGHTARRRMIRTDSYKYIKRLDNQTVCRYCGIQHAPERELYDLDADPDECQNIIDTNPDLAQELDEKLETWIERRQAPRKDDGSYELSSDVEDHLEEMGYL